MRLNIIIRCAWRGRLNFGRMLRIKSLVTTKEHTGTAKVKWHRVNQNELTRILVEFYKAGHSAKDLPFPHARSSAFLTPS